MKKINFLKGQCCWCLFYVIWPFYLTGCGTWKDLMKIAWFGFATKGESVTFFERLFTLKINHVRRSARLDSRSQVCDSIQAGNTWVRGAWVETCKSPAVYSDSPHCFPFQPFPQYFFAIFLHIYSQLSFLHIEYTGSSCPNILFSFTNLFDLSWRTKADKRQWITRIIFQQFYHR